LFSNIIQIAKNCAQTHLAPIIDIGISSFFVIQIRLNTNQKKVEQAARKLLNQWTGGVGVTRGNATTSRMRDGD
jgi:hypothetical protein